MTVDKHNIDWTPIEKALNEGTFSGYKMAVLETEKILRQTLNEKRIPGNVVDRQIFIMKPHLSRPGDLEHARLITGKVVREPGFDLSREDTKIIISAYYHAISDIAGLQLGTLSLSQRAGLALQRLIPLEQARALLFWITVAAFGILFFSETNLGRTAAERIADLVSFFALFVFAPIGALYLLIKIATSFRRGRDRNRDLL